MSLSTAVHFFRFRWERIQAVSRIRAVIDIQKSDDESHS